MPAVRISPALGGGAGHADDDAGRRDDAVVGAEDSGPQPVQASADVTVRLVVPT
jgi:hypothetical protein